MKVYEGTTFTRETAGQAIEQRLTRSRRVGKALAAIGLAAGVGIGLTDTQNMPKLEAAEVVAALGGSFATASIERRAAINTCDSIVGHYIQGWQYEPSQVSWSLRAEPMIGLNEDDRADSPYAQPSRIMSGLRAGLGELTAVPATTAAYVVTESLTGQDPGNAPAVLIGSVLVSAVTWSANTSSVAALHESYERQLDHAQYPGRY